MLYTEREILKEVYTSTVRMRLLSNGIIHYTYLENATVDKVEHLENHAALVNIANVPQHPLLVDALEYVNITSEARKLIRSLEPVTPILARAIVTDSMGLKMIISFYKNVNRPIYPMQVFKKYEDAWNWLLSLRTSMK